MALKRVVVLGAGVSGLSTATLLLQQEKKYKVHLIAKHFPGDQSYEYTSPWSGAYWRSYALKDDIKQQEIDKESYNHFRKLAGSPQNKTGIRIIDGFDYWDHISEDFSEPWFKTLCPEFRDLKREELPDGIKLGFTFKTVSFNPQTYLNHLLDTFTSLGGTTQHASVSHINECIESDTDIIINCTGIHSRTLGGVEDPNVYAVRGQTVIVQSPHINYAFLRQPCGLNAEKLGSASAKEMTYAIARDGGEVVLGGTYEQHNYTTEIDHEISEAIIQRCLTLRPDLLPPGQSKLTIKGYGVGLRPCREGGARLDCEWIASKKFDKNVLLCHNYGHGGAGFQTSYGSAKHIIKLMEDKLNENDKN
ncbi:1524_t:CDS:10 [Acaulospora morrowiae]|uniref:1524_t:CDS:1 n=1 Tax=Acaulospora morrowiae TaxID=94023 RepID=A0A9N8V1Y2_9GLOM|nr:1524_t:CDS:10 [Acaulospora morrowiae]